MVADGTPILFLTFLLAIIGYVNLTITVWNSVKGKYSPFFWRFTAAIIVAHVIMIWAFRYEWQFGLAVRNGYVGFLLFHAALGLIVASVFLAREQAIRLIHVSFCIVTMGASGAVFLYEAVEMYRIIVLGCALIGGVSLVRHYSTLLKDKRSVST